MTETQTPQLPATRAPQLPARVKPSLPAMMPSFQIATLEDAEKMANLFVTAGLFDVSEKEADKGMTPQKKAAINTIKIIAGASYGLGPFQSMRGFHCIKGKVEPGYQTILALVDSHPRYGYRILQHTKDVAEIEWSKDGAVVGKTSFNTDDMMRAKLGGDSWMRFPRQMRLARATREGVDAYCSTIFNGPCSTLSDADYDSVNVAEIQGLESDVEIQVAQYDRNPTATATITRAQEIADERTQSQEKQAETTRGDIIEATIQIAEAQGDAQKAEAFKEMRKVTSEQLQQITKRVLSLQWQPKDRTDFTKKEHGVEPKDLTFDQADDVIAKLDILIAEKAQSNS